MSKTDKTDPTWVKTQRHRIEHHDHINGVCELATNPDNGGWNRGECYIDADWYAPEMRCGCSRCDGDWVGPVASRKKRRKARQETHMDARQYFFGLEA